MLTRFVVDTWGQAAVLVTPPLVGKVAGEAADMRPGPGGNPIRAPWNESCPCRLFRRLIEKKHWIHFFRERKEEVQEEGKSVAVNNARKYILL